jgi:hypothetical protein
MTDSEIILAIQALLDRTEWSSDTLEHIANLLTRNGYVIRDLNE